MDWYNIAVLIFIGQLSSTDKPKPINPLPTTNVARVPTKMEIFDKIQLDFSGRKGGFGSIMMANFTIKNTSKLNIKDVSIKCDHYSKSKTQIDSNTRDVFEILEANSERYFSDFNMGLMHSQASFSSCYIKDFKLIK